MRNNITLTRSSTISADKTDLPANSIHTWCIEIFPQLYSKDCDYSNTMNTSRAIHSVRLQNVNSLLPTSVLAINGSSAVSLNDQKFMYRNLCPPSDDLPLPKGDFSPARNKQQSLHSCSLIQHKRRSSERQSLEKGLTMSPDNSTFRKNQVCSTERQCSTRKFERSRNWCSPSEEFSFQEFCPRTKKLKVSKFPAIAESQKLQGTVDFDSLTEDQRESEDCYPLANKSQNMSRDFHYLCGAPKGFEESKCLYSHSEYKRNSMTTFIENVSSSPNLCSIDLNAVQKGCAFYSTDDALQSYQIYTVTGGLKRSNSFSSNNLQRFRTSHYRGLQISRTPRSNNLHVRMLWINHDSYCPRTLISECLHGGESFCKRDVQRSKQFQAVLHGSNSFRADSQQKSKDNEVLKESTPSASGSTHLPMPPPSEDGKERTPVRSSGANDCGNKILNLKRLMSTAITKTCLRVLLLLLFICQINCEDVPLNCTNKVHLTSSNYPSHYPNDANMKWHVTAPSGRRVLVEFNDFNLEQPFDNLDLLDIADIRKAVRYTGDRSQIPSFLTQGNAMNATFASFGTGTRRGFNITVSCYEKSNSSGGRLVSGNTPAEGSLELLSQSGEWVGVCEDNLSATVAEVICGELGYPGVKEISYKTDGCQSDVNDQTCVRSPSCEDDTYLIRDCSIAIGNCTTFSSVEIKCYEPGYKGCYEFKVSQLQNGSIYYSASKCVSSCRGKTPYAIAILKGEECFCSTASEVNLPGRPFAKNQTACISTSKNNQQTVNALVYNVSVGFCNQTNDVINGTWDSNITWFGSIVHLTCDEGYSLNGSEALQCVPGVSSYYPVWNDLMPTCDRFEGGTSSSSSSKAETPEPGHGPGEDATRGIPTPYIILICIIVLILFIISIISIAWVIKKTKRKLQSRLARALMSIGSNGQQEVLTGTDKPTELQQMDSERTVEEDIEDIEEVEQARMSMSKTP